MIRTLKANRFAILALIALGICAFFALTKIGTRQNVSLPGWVPLIGSHHYTIYAELPTAQALDSGQGQTVDVAGVPIGEVAGVKLQNGHAVVKLNLDESFRHRVYRNATLLMRPKTGLKDMVVQLDPGSKSAGEIPNKGKLPLNRSLPDVDFDEILSALNPDVRNHLVLLLQGADEGLKGNRDNLAMTLRELNPVARDTRAALAGLAQRRKKLERTIHSLSVLTTAIGSKDQEIERFVKQTNAVFATMAQNERALSGGLAQLAPTLQATDRAMLSTGKLANNLGPAAERLRKGTPQLASGMQALQPFLTQSTPVIQKKIRPFAAAATPVLKDLAPATASLAHSAPQLTSSLKDINKAVNALAYTKKGTGGNSYLFWAGWGNHIMANIFGQQDAHGPNRRGLFLSDCASIQVLGSISDGNPQLGTLVGLLNPPTVEQACGNSSSTLGALPRSAR